MLASEQLPCLFWKLSIEWIAAGATRNKCTQASTPSELCLGRVVGVSPSSLDQGLWCSALSNPGHGKLKTGRTEEEMVRAPLGWGWAVPDQNEQGRRDAAGRWQWPWGWRLRDSVLTATREVSLSNRTVSSHSDPVGCLPVERLPSCCGPEG